MTATPRSPGIQSCAAPSGARSKILAAAVSLVLAERREPDDLLRSVTMTSVANAAGVSRSGVRYHFATREELLRATIDHLLFDDALADGSALLEPAERLHEAPPIEELIRAFVDFELRRLAPTPSGQAEGDRHVMWLLLLCHSLRRPDVTAAMRSDLERVFAGLALNVVDPILAAYGRRPRGGLTTTDLVEMVNMVFEGAAIQQLLGPAGPSRRVNLDNESWTLVSLAVRGIIDAYTVAVESGPAH